MRLKIDTEELVQKDVISSATAEHIHQYYNAKTSSTSTRILVLFGSLGALMIGLGIILVVGHNWDNLSRNNKIFLSYLPLIVGQACCLFTLIKKPDSKAWRESSAIFLTLAVGASISLISQIYHIDGNWKDFLFTWSLLILPVIYIMKSSGTFFLYLIAITSYAFSKLSFFSWEISYNYWYMLLAIIPFYIMEIRKDVHSNAIGFYNWMIAISTTITLFLFFDFVEEMMILGYLLLALLFIAVGKMERFKTLGNFKNGFLPIGIFGLVVNLFLLSSKEINRSICYNQHSNIFDYHVEIIVCLVITAICLLITWLTIKSQKTKLSLSIATIGTWILFIINISNADAYILNNVILFVGAIALIYYSTQTHKISLLNLGMIIISLLIYIYFLNTNLGFLFKGLVFILVGIGFFVANLIFTKTIGKNEK